MTATALVVSPTFAAAVREHFEGRTPEQWELGRFMVRWQAANPGQPVQVPGPDAAMLEGFKRARGETQLGAEAPAPRANRHLRRAREAYARRIDRAMAKGLPAEPMPTTPVKLPRSSALVARGARNKRNKRKAADRARRGWVQQPRLRSKTVYDVAAERFADGHLAFYAGFVSQARHGGWVGAASRREKLPGGGPAPRRFWRKLLAARVRARKLFVRYLERHNRVYEHPGRVAAAARASWLAQFRATKLARRGGRPGVRLGTKAWHAAAALVRSPLTA